MPVHHHQFGLVDIMYNSFSNCVDACNQLQPPKYTRIEGREKQSLDDHQLHTLPTNTHPATKTGFVSP